MYNIIVNIFINYDEIKDFLYQYIATCMHMNIKLMDKLMARVHNTHCVLCTLANGQTVVWSIHS